MSRITSHIEVGSVTAELRPEGGSFYRNDRNVHLSTKEWVKLFNLPEFSKPEQLETDRFFSSEKIVLNEEANYPIFVALDVFNNVFYIDVRHYYKNKNGDLRPTCNGIKIRLEQFEVIKEWQSKFYPLYEKNIENDKKG